MYEEHQQIGYTLVTLPLEVMFCPPKFAVTQPIHRLGDVPRLVEYRGKTFIREGPVIHRYALQADVIDVHVAGELCAESRYHPILNFLLEYFALS